MEWNLSDLFANKESFTIEVDNLYEKIAKYKQDFPTEIQETNLTSLLDEYWLLKERANQVLLYASLGYYKRVQDETALEAKIQAESLVSHLNAELSFFPKEITKCTKLNLEKWLIKNPDLAQYRFYLNSLFRFETHLQNEERVNQIKKKEETIRTLLSNYNFLARNTKYGTITIDGKEVELTDASIQKYISAKDRETRKNAFTQINTAYEKNAEELAHLLQSINQARTDIAFLEDYASVLEKVLFEENTPSSLLDTLLTTIHSQLPLLHQYVDIKKKHLGLNEIHLYDLNASLSSDSSHKWTIEEALEVVKSALSPLGPKYQEVLTFLIENHHVDTALEEEKHQTIVFSWASYAFMNFRGNYIDLKNLAHELGHIVNYYLSEEQQPYLYTDSTKFVGELTSLVNEILLNRYLYQTAQTEEEKLFYLSKNIENHITTIYRQTMYTEFETKVYQAIQANEPIDSSILKEWYGSLLQTYYGTDVTCDAYANVEWGRQGRFYRYSYYSFQYVFGLLMASIVVDSFTNQPTQTEELYLDFLSSGGNDDSLSLLQKLHLDLTDPNTLQHSFRVLASEIKEVESIQRKKS